MTTPSTTASATVQQVTLAGSFSSTVAANTTTNTHSKNVLMNDKVNALQSTINVHLGKACQAMTQANLCTVKANWHTAKIIEHEIIADNHKAENHRNVILASRHKDTVDKCITGANSYQSTNNCTQASQEMSLANVHAAITKLYLTRANWHKHKVAENQAKAIWHRAQANLHTVRNTFMLAQHKALTDNARRLSEKLKAATATITS